MTLCLVGVASATPLQWATFRSPEGRFSVSVFGKPETKVSHTSTPVGGFDQHSFTWVQGDIECDLAYSDVPSLSTLGGGRILFDEVARGFKNRMHEPVKNETAWKFQSNPGRSFEFHRAKLGKQVAQCGMVRSTLVKNRLYVLIVTWDRNAIPDSAADATHFFDSFTVDAPKPE